MKAIVSKDGQQLVAIVEDDVPTRADVTRAYVDNSSNPPAHNPATQRLTELLTFSPTTVTRSLVAVPLSAEQLDELATQRETARIRELIDALRTGQGTVAERLIRLERAVAHLCKLTLQQ